jgi:hypothetical protein
MCDWTCVQTKPGEEVKAQRWIKDREHEVYLPLVRERRGACVRCSRVICSSS